MDEVFRTQQPGWQARVDASERSEITVAGGRVRPATEYQLSLLFGGKLQSVRVHAVLADDLNPAARADPHYQQQYVLRHVFTQLESGWVPEHGDLPPIVIRNPHAGYRHADTTPRPSFIDRLRRRR